MSTFNGHIAEFPDIQSMSPSRRRHTCSYSAVDNVDMQEHVFGLRSRIVLVTCGLTDACKKSTTFGDAPILRRLLRASSVMFTVTI